MSTYRMTPDGQWMRINPDGSLWQLGETDKRVSGRPPRLYRGIRQASKDVEEEGTDSINQEFLTQELQMPDKCSDLGSNQEPALGTDFELPLPERFRALPIPIRYQAISSFNNSEAYRVIELKEEFVTYKEQYSLFRQFIESPNRIELDQELNKINTWSAVASSPKVQIGKRGGRYTIAVTKKGRYYRRYF